jgi:hypothetical protein
MAMTLRDEFEPIGLAPFGFCFGDEIERSWQRWDESDLKNQIARADEWLQLVGCRKTINRDIGGSYGLKHRVERWAGIRWPMRDYYVSNGCFLMAAIRLGFIYQHCSFDNPNAYLNISGKGVHRLEDDIKRRSKMLWAAQNALRPSDVALH